MIVYGGKIRMIDSSIYNLHCFSILAQQLNYTKAAELLNISQPALSKIIRTLEKELGYDLLYRSTRAVKLTEAGELFFDRIRICLNEINQLVLDAGDIAKGHTGVLRIGFLPYTFSCRLPDVVKKYKKEHPNVRLMLRDGEEDDLKYALLNDEIDIALVSDWGTDLPDEMERVNVYEDDYCAVVSMENPLAHKENVTLKMLENERFLTLNQKITMYMDGDYGTNRIIELCTKNGFLPNIVGSVQGKTLIGLCLLVGCNEGIAILASHMEKFVEEDYHVKFLPIQDIGLKFNAQMCYKKSNRNSCIKDFADVMTKYR